MNLPTSLFPSIDLAYIEGKYSGLSTGALLHAWSSLKGNGVRSTRLYKFNDTKVAYLYLDLAFFQATFS